MGVFIFLNWVSSLSKLCDTECCVRQKMSRIDSGSLVTVLLVTSLYATSRICDKTQNVVQTLIRER